MIKAGKRCGNRLRIVWSPDLGVLQLAYAFEQATQLWRRRPMIAAGQSN